MNNTTSIDFDVAISHPELLCNIARTMHLLATSKPRQAHDVRILVYGQSISKQLWWLKVKQHLRQSFPDARLIMENWAIGGFHSTRLRQCAAHDARLFYPDLILFHDYGPEDDYEAIIRTLRRETTAEIAIQTDHVALDQDEAWHDRHAEVWLPDLCRRYELALIDVRANWKRYLKQERVAPQLLLNDRVHLNDEGNELLYEIVKAHLVHDPACGPDPQGLVTTLRPGAGFDVTPEGVTLSFEGNRLDLVPKGALDVEITLSGASPSSLLKSYVAERPLLDRSWPPRVGLPVRIDLGAPRDGSFPEAEHWTIHVTEVRDNGAGVDFELFGSRQGFDGAGSSGADFVSDSGRIVLARDAWFLRESPEFFDTLPAVKRGDQLTFAVRCLSRDRITPQDGVPDRVTLVQVAGSGPHTLTLRSRDGAPLPIAALYVHCSPLS
jgi:hypothetical protein